MAERPIRAPACKEGAGDAEAPPAVYYIPPTDIAPIACGTAEEKRVRPALPLAADLKGEMRTFRCKGCDKQTKIIVQD